MAARTPPVPYIDGLINELNDIEADYTAILNGSKIINVHPQSGGGMVFIGFAQWGWAPSTEAQQTERMDLLARVKSFKPRFLLLFPSPTPEVAKRHETALKLLSRWLKRPDGDHSVPHNIPTAIHQIRTAVGTLRSAKDLLPTEKFAQHVVVDTNVLIDNPDLSQFTDQIGHRYLVHLLPVVLRELDDHKRSGRTETLREAAKKADRRLKSLRDNGDVTVGAKVAGEVWAVFEHIEPRGSNLPSWLDLDVPDDRFVGSSLLLVSRHPGANTVVATSDLNLQTKLAAVRLPFIDPD